MYRFFTRYYLEVAIGNERSFTLAGNSIAKERTKTKNRSDNAATSREYGLIKKLLQQSGFALSP